MKVNAYVYVLQGGYPVLLKPGDTVPDGVTVSNPAVLDAEDDDAEDAPAKSKRPTAAQKAAAEKEAADKAAAEAATSE